MVAETPAVRKGYRSHLSYGRGFNRSWFYGEIETLRKSNYELSKVGANLINQIAKAFNILVNAGGNGKIPEVGKKIASLRRDISEHIEKVLIVLNAGTAVWENKKGTVKSRAEENCRKE